MKEALSRKWRERQLFDAFIRLSHINAVVAEEREAPDFILRVDGKVVGVELTEIYVEDDGQPLAPKARESLATKAVSQARQQYEKRGGRPLHVAVGFIPNADLQVNDRTRIAESLAEFLLMQELPADGYKSWSHSRRLSLPSQIGFINAFLVPSPDCAHWYAPQAGWVAPLTEKIISDSIGSKVTKLDSYRSAVQDSWLVLVVAGGAPSQAFEPAPDLAWETIVSPFARTFLLSVMEGRVYEIGKKYAA